MTHALKTWPEYFKSLLSGEKPFELRKYDRPFKVGDIILAQEFDNIKQVFTGEEGSFIITYLLKDAPHFGLMEGFVIIGLKENGSEY